MRYLIQDQEGVYNRLFTKILDSSIWLEPSSTRIVWVTLLAAMDEDGFAHFSAIENLASRARVTVEEAQKAVDCFTAPDPNSANTAYEGRRIERIPGGWLILNASEHRKTFNREIRREQTRLRVAKYRAKKEGNKDGVTPALQGVTAASDTECASDKKRESVRERGLVDSEWIARLCNDETYNGIDVKREFGKMANWCKEHKVVATRRRFVNWLNRADKPIGGLDSRPITKYNLPLPKGCSIARNGDVLDYSGRIMDINQVRKAT